MKHFTLQNTARSFSMKKRARLAHFNQRPRLARFNGRPAILFMRSRKFIKQLRHSGLGNLTAQTINGLFEVYNHMIRRLAIVSLWIVLTPSFILIFLAFLTAGKQATNLPNVSTELDTSITSDQNAIEANVVAVEIADPRPFIVEKFLRGTPLAPYSTYIVEVSDKYGIDYRLIPAIAMKESGGGAAVDPLSHNAWGFENGKTYFPSWEYAIDRVASTLKEGYISKGLTTPEQIMAKYAPPQLETGGKWARDINHFYSQMNTL